jgi:hypothetical protein
MQRGSNKKQIRPPQQQKRPGLEKIMKPQPVFDYPETKGNNKLKNKVAFITGGDSGIGKAVAILFAMAKRKVPHSIPVGMLLELYNTNLFWGGLK